MNAQSVSQSIRMFKSVLGGKTYAAIARESTLARSAVERRVKALARELQTVVGVVGVDEDEIPDAEFLRTRRDNYLEALEHYHHERAMPSGTKRHTLSDDDVDRALARIALHSKHKSRDAALLLVLLTTAAKPIDIARLEVRDYLNEDGTVREQSILRAETAVTGEERPLFFASRRIISLLDEYLERRLGQKTGTADKRPYRGLDPHSPLFLTDEGLPMPIKISAGSRRQRYFCRAILDVYQRIFALAGLHGASPLCARRTVAKRLAERGCDLQQIGEVLGLKGRSAVRNLVGRQARAMPAPTQEPV